MFATLRMNIDRLLPQLRIGNLLRRIMPMHQNILDLEEMPENWQRDLGILDGRDRRGDPGSGAFRATRMIHLHRNL